MVTVIVEVLSSIAALTGILVNVISLADGLRHTSTKANDIARQLRTLNTVLQQTDQVFKRSIKLMEQSGVHELDVEEDTILLDICIIDCITTCEAYDRLLQDIATSRLKAVAWKRGQGELTRLYNELEAEKSTLSIRLIVIREKADNHRHKVELMPEESTNGAPPPYVEQNPKPEETFAAPSGPEYHQETYPDWFERPVDEKGETYPIPTWVQATPTGSTYSDELPPALPPRPTQQIGTYTYYGDNSSVAYTAMVDDTQKRDKRKRKVVCLAIAGATAGSIAGPLGAAIGGGVGALVGTKIVQRRSRR